MFKNFLLLIASSTVGWLLMELVLQAVTHNPNNYFFDRYLFTTPGYVRNINEKLWIYSPDQEIREVAVYGFSEKPYLPGDNFRIEYQCRFTTNNLGFIQKRDFSPGDSVTLMLGDSFLAGQGGCPWFDRLIKASSRRNLMNGSLMGTGIAQWQYLLKHLQGKGIVISKILVVAISNDFIRTPWIWSDEQLLCLDTGRCDGEQYWEPVRIDEADNIIIDKAIARSRDRHGTLSAKRATWNWMQRNLRTVDLVVRSWSRFTASGGEPKSYPETVASLSYMKRLGVPVEFVLVPQKNEVGLFPNRADARLAESMLQEAQIAYRWCELEPEHFLPIDAHPTREGYDQLINCISRLLE